MSKVVIDVGCTKYGGDDSIPVLVDEFEPDVLYGFDPAEVAENRYTLKNTLVITAPNVAWTYAGMIGFRLKGLGGSVDLSQPRYPCFDLAEFILTLGDDGDVEIILKLDCEKSEYELIPHLRKSQADRRLSLALVEWHCLNCGMGWLQPPVCAHCETPAKEMLALQNVLHCETRDWGH